MTTNNKEKKSLINTPTNSLCHNWISRWPTVGNLHGLIPYDYGRDDFLMVNESRLWDEVNDVSSTLSSHPDERDVEWCAGKLGGLEGEFGSGDEDKTRESASRYEDYVAEKERLYQKHGLVIAELRSEVEDDKDGYTPEEVMQKLELIASAFEDASTQSISPYSPLVGSSLDDWSSKGILHPITEQALETLGIDISSMSTRLAMVNDTGSVVAYSPDGNKFQNITVHMSAYYDYIRLYAPNTGELLNMMSIGRRTGQVEVSSMPNGDKKVLGKENEVAREFCVNIFAPTDQEVALLGMTYPEHQLITHILKFREQLSEGLLSSGRYFM